MPAATRQMFKFLSKGSKHRRATMGDHETIDTERHRNHRGGKGNYVQQLDEPEVINSAIYADTDPVYGGAMSGPDPEGSTHSTHSITAKPTTATLAETFSSGAGEYSGVGSIDEGSSLLFDEERQYREDATPELYVGVGDEDEDDAYNQTYTEFDNQTREDDDLDTLDYTATVNDRNVVYEQDDVDAQHLRGNEFLLENGNAEQWEETSAGYDTCSHTLNTNLEGVDYLRTGAADHSQVYGVSSGYEGQPQYYYEDEQGQYQQTYADEQYYDIDGNYVVDQYDAHYANQGHFFVDNNTVANSTIATGVDSHYHSANGVEDDADSAPIDAYDSEDSGSSWDEEGTREMSLLDGRQNEEGDTFDDDEESESSSESDDDSRHSRRRGSKSVLQILQQMKHCSLKGSSVSYDDDQDYVPDVAQISTGATSMTSMTDSYESRSSSSYRRKQYKHKSRREEKVSRNIDNLFNKVSALGQELLGNEEEERPRSSRKSKNKKKSLRRRDRDPATKIVDSLRDIFSCGHPRHY